MRFVVRICGMAAPALVGATLVGILSESRASAFEIRDLGTAIRHRDLTSQFECRRRNGRLSAF